MEGESSMADTSVQVSDWLGLAELRCKSPRPRRVRHEERGLTQEEVQRLLAAVGTLPGYYRGSCNLPRSSWWKAFVRLGWDTKLRLSDILGLRFADMHGPTIQVSQQGRVVVCPLEDDTLQRITAIREPARELILPWSARLESFYVAFRALAKAARADGTTKYIRCDGA
jgi:integrase